MTGRLPLLCAAVAAVCHVAIASVAMMASMGGNLMRQCKQQDGCNIPDEHFQRLMSFDRTFMDEEDNTAAWNWLSCMYEQGGMLDDNFNVDQDSLGMYIGAMWTDKEEKKAAEKQINGCAASAKAGENRAQKVKAFYKCVFDKIVNKELILPTGAGSMMEQMKAGKDCAVQHKVSLEDISDLCLWKVPINPVQAGYAACMVVATRSDGDQMCSCYISKGIETIKDDARRAHYEEKFKQCKDSFPNYQENYDKVNEFDKFKGYVAHMYDCFVKNVDDISLDDFFRLH